MHGEIGVDPAGVDDGRDWQDDDSRENRLDGARCHLHESDEFNWTRCLDAVLDLPGEAKLLGKLQGDARNALELHRQTGYARNEDGRKGRTIAPCPTDSLTYPREDIEEHKDEEERLDHGSICKRDEMLAQHYEVAQEQRRRRCPACRPRRTNRRRPDPMHALVGACCA